MLGRPGGGRTGRNPRGPEYGFSRDLAPTEAGRTHPLLAGRPPCYDAPAMHLDAVIELPPGAVDAYADDLCRLAEAPGGYPYLLRRPALGPQVVDADCRRREIAKFLMALVRPAAQAAR